MKITELKDKILIAELDPKKDYIILAQSGSIEPEALRYVQAQNERVRDLPVVYCRDIDKAIRFIEIPKKK